MNSRTIALFGEAEKGDYRTAYFCQSVPQLAEYFGNPPSESKGLHFAVQTLMYNSNVIFFRVEEEGFSTQDYLLGLQLLGNKDLISDLTALCMPGVGDVQIINASTPICELYRSILITSEADLYDCLTSRGN